MKLFYLATPERIKEIKHDCHWLALGDSTHLLVCVRWRDEIHEVEWANKEGVIRLPHPIFQSTAAVGDEVAGHLGKRFSMAPHHTVHDLIKQSAIEDPWMRLHVL